MTFITFIYKIGSNPTTYFGKYVTDYVSDDHNGLDTEFKYELLDGLNKYREQKGYSKLNLRSIKIGIVGFAEGRHISTHSSRPEFKCFDIYIDSNKKTYVNGNLLPFSK